MILSPALVINVIISAVMTMMGYAQLPLFVGESRVKAVCYVSGILSVQYVSTGRN